MATEMQAMTARDSFVMTSRPPTPTAAAITSVGFPAPLCQLPEM
jgi:hypothetical protein